MKGLNVIITDLTGYSFEVKWNRNINLVKGAVWRHYEEKMKNDFCKDIGILRKDFKNYEEEYLASSYHNRMEQCKKIELIYNGEVLKLWPPLSKKIHITCPDIHKNNNMNVIFKDKDSDDETDTDSVY